MDTKATVSIQRIVLFISVYLFGFKNANGD
jgi:hypothetical protein